MSAPEAWTALAAALTLGTFGRRKKLFGGTLSVILAQESWRSGFLVPTCVLRTNCRKHWALRSMGRIELGME